MQYSGSLICDRVTFLNKNISQGFRLHWAGDRSICQKCPTKKSQIKTKNVSEKVIEQKLSDNASSYDSPIKREYLMMSLSLRRWSSRSINPRNSGLSHIMEALDHQIFNAQRRSSGYNAYFFSKTFGTNTLICFRLGIMKSLASVVVAGVCRRFVSVRLRVIVYIVFFNRRTVRWNMRSWW